MCMICRCGHLRSEHMHGVCVGIHDSGDTCDCMEFGLKGARAKYGTSKKTDVLDQWSKRSIDAPLSTSQDSGTLSQVIAGPIKSLDQRPAEDQFDAAVSAEYRKGRTKRGRSKPDRDLCIYRRYMAGETLAGISEDFSMSTAGIYMVVTTVRCIVISVAREKFPEIAHLVSARSPKRAMKD